MIAHTCRRCGSSKLQRNGHTASGQQKFHCKDCDLYGTLERKDAERALRKHAAENLLSERLSQRAIARTLRMGRRTVAAIIKKKS
jgi:transposase-like protein